MKKYLKRVLLAIIIGLFFIILGILMFIQSSKIITPEILNYNEKSKINYKVYLKDKEYYHKDYLDEGMQYISNIIDYINLDFKYNIKFDKKVNLNYKTYVVTTIKVVNDMNGKIIYEDRDQIKENNISETKENEINISDNIKIDYQKYNKKINEFKTNYGINANSKLVVDYYISYKLDDIDKNDAKKLSVEIPLSEQMIVINKDEDINIDNYYSKNTNDNIINKKLKIISISFLILGTFVIIYSVLIIKNSNLSKYDKYIYKILKQYDAYITKAIDDVYVDKPIVQIESFKELLDVRNNEEKAIVYIKESETRSKFMIVTDNQVYTYIAKAEDIK